MANGPASTITISAQINFERIQTQIEAAVLSVVNESALQAYEIAQQKVPVRRIFKGGKRHYITLPALTKENMTEAKTPGTPEYERFRQLEAAAELGGLPEGVERYQPSRRIQTNRPWENRNFAMPGDLARDRGSQRRGRIAQKLDLRRQLLKSEFSKSGEYAFSMLSSKGRYELRTGRANYKGRVGGRLKGEMEIHEAKAGPMFKAEVESPTYYARYVEFGTRRAAAQPYLRPGLMTVQLSYRDNMLRALSRAGRFGIPSKRGGKPAWVKEITGGGTGTSEQDTVPITGVPGGRRTTGVMDIIDQLARQMYGSGPVSTVYKREDFFK